MQAPDHKRAPDRPQSHRHSATGLRDALAAFDLAGYVSQTRRHGRMRQPASTRERACELYELIVSLRARGTALAPNLLDAAELAERVLYSDWFLAGCGLPRYRAYINLPVLNWYLGTYRRVRCEEIWHRCATAIDLLLRDALAFERRSLAGHEERSQATFDRDAVESRVDRLESVLAYFDWADAGDAPNSAGAPPDDWASCLSQPRDALALVHLTVFPLTEEHDEYVFIRTLHVSECCFWGILTAASAASQALKHGRPALAERHLEVALSFAALLSPMLHVLKTMTSERFERFREETGSASALQSRTYQLMQIALTGVPPETVDVVTSIEELRDLRHYDHPSYVTLADLATPYYADSTRDDAPLRRQIDALSRELRKWRKLHRGIVRNYLASRKTGTGGTDGAAYLKLTVDTTIGATSALRSHGSQSDRRRCADRLRGRPSFGWALTEAVGHARPLMTAAN